MILVTCLLLFTRFKNKNFALLENLLGNFYLFF